MTCIPSRDSNGAFGTTAAGTDGTTVTDSATTVLGAIGADNANNAFASTSVVGNVDGSVLERLEHMAAGGTFVIQSTIVSSTIPNNTQTAAAITGAASGVVVVEQMIFETNGTGVAAPTNLEITTDNASGLTGAAAPQFLVPVSGLGANKTLVASQLTTPKIPFTVENGKKVFMHGDDAGGTGAGTVRVTMLCRRVTAGASMAGV